MNFSELQKKISNLTNRNISQSEIAAALGITRSTVNIRTKNNSEVKVSELDKVSDYFKLDRKQLTVYKVESNFAEIPVRGEVEASMGFGVTVYDESQTATYSISKQLAKDLDINLNCSEIIFARGNSMHPTIEGGDSLLIDRSKKEIYDGKIYCVRYDGQLYAKRLQKIAAGKVTMISDNKDYIPITVDLDSPIDFEVIGEVRWSGRAFR